MTGENAGQRCTSFLHRAIVISQFIFHRDLGTGGAFAHRFFSFQVNLMRAVHQTIEDRIGQRRIANVVVPVADGKLTRHDARPGPDPIVE